MKIGAGVAILINRQRTGFKTKKDTFTVTKHNSQEDITILKCVNTELRELKNKCSEN